jgi:hypothetical protein
MKVCYTERRAKVKEETMQCKWCDGRIKQSRKSIQRIGQLEYHPVCLRRKEAGKPKPLTYADMR